MWNRWIAAGALFCAGVSHAFAPQSGTWIVTEELDGKPGRGLSIDVQGSTLVMQMYAYDNAGNPTFYLTSGAITDHRYSGALNTYRGGRSFGSGPQSGTPSGSPGNVSMRFDSGTKGYISFPNEPEKAISRFNFAYPATPESLKSTWLLTSIGANLQTEFFQLVKVIPGTPEGNGMVMSPNNQVGCENIVRGPNAGIVACVRLSPQGELLRFSVFNQSINDGEGRSGPTSTTMSDLLFVRRLLDGNDDFTGILHKSDSDLTAIDPAFARTALERAVQEMQAQ